MKVLYIKITIIIYKFYTNAWLTHSYETLPVLREWRAAGGGTRPYWGHSFLTWLPMLYAVRIMFNIVNLTYKMVQYMY